MTERGVGLQKYWIFSHPPYFSILLKASSAMSSCMPCTVVQAFAVKQPPKCRSVEYKRGRKPLQYLQVMVMSTTTLTTFCIDICQSQLNPTSIRQGDSCRSDISKPVQLRERGEPPTVINMPSFFPREVRIFFTPLQIPNLT